MKLKALLLGFIFTLIALPQALKAEVTTPTLTAQWVKGNLIGDAQPNLTLRLYMSGDVATSETVILAGLNLLIELDEEFVNELTSEPAGGGEQFDNIVLSNPSDANVGLLSDNTTPAELLNDYRVVVDAYPCATNPADRDIINAMRWDAGGSLIYPVSGAPAGKTWIGLTAIYQTSVNRTDVGCSANEENLYNSVTTVATPAGKQDIAVVADILFILDGDALDTATAADIEDFFKSVKILNLPGATTSLVFSDIGQVGAPLIELSPVDPSFLVFDDTLLDEFTSVRAWTQMAD